MWNKTIYNSPALLYKAIPNGLNYGYFEIYDNKNHQFIGWLNAADASYSFSSLNWYINIRNMSDLIQLAESLHSLFKD